MTPERVKSDCSIEIGKCVSQSELKFNLAMKK